MTIHEALKTPIFELIKVFEETNKIYSVLNSMIDLGLGYLNLGQMSMNLSVVKHNVLNWLKHWEHHQRNKIYIS